MEEMTMTEIARLIEGLRSAGWEEKKKEYTRKNLAVLFFLGLFFLPVCRSCALAPMISF
jgi:hypothetical protein